MKRTPLSRSLFSPNGEWATISLTRIKTQFSSIRWRIVLAYLLIIVAAFLIVATSLIRLVGEYLFSQKIREEQRVAESLASRLAVHLALYDAEALYREAVDAAQSGSRVLILDMNGVVQTDSASQYNGLRLEYKEVASVLTASERSYGIYGLDETGFGGWFGIVGGPSSGSEPIVGLYSEPIRSGERMIGVLLYITLSQDVIVNLSTIQRQMMIWLVLVAIVVALLSFFVVTRMVSRPIEELNQGIKRMTQGDLTSRVAVRGHSEFAQLAEAFNSMSERLETLDQARNQFVSNASHELKTPLSTMKILIETLLYQESFDPDTQTEFLRDINLEIDRLNSVISDLLTLVNIDSGNLNLRLSSVKLGEIVRDTVRRLMPLAQKKKIALDAVINDEITLVADNMKLGQVVYNLVDNAIKYTPEEGAVRVEISRVGKKAVVKVSDTGMGVPRADLIHIFDRFYRVDKARSRETGGTGLGLSIVKQMVLLHGGTISVVSEEDVGSTFTVELPIETV